MANLSVEEVVAQGLARVQEYAASAPRVRSVLYRRVSLRQQELAMQAARINRDYFGVVSVAQLVGGAADLNDIGPPVPQPELVQRLTVETVGGGATSAAGDEVSIVRFGDESAEEPPRVTIRSGVIRQVKNDLAGISALRVYYSRLPDSLLSTETGTTLVVIPPPFDELLVLDLAELIVERAMHGTVDDQGKLPAKTMIEEEVKEWEAKWRAHVAEYAAQRTRFTR